MGLTTIYRRTGEPATAREQIATVITMFREMEMRSWLEKAEAEMKDMAG